MLNDIFQSKKLSRIKDDEISGYLESSNDLLVRSLIHGDIFCGGTVFCNGTVTGNIRANQVQLNNACIMGEITCRIIMTDELSYVQGAIIAENGSVTCHVGGEVTITANRIYASHMERRDTNHL